MKRLITALILLLPTTLLAQETPSIDTAIHARIKGRPDIALGILNGLEKDDPRNARIKFEKGVALAATGQCAAAARTFNAGRALTPVPSFRTASQDAMDDLCPKLARLETNFAASFSYETNKNSGSETNTIDIGGLTYTLSEDALARAGSTVSVFGSANYNIPIGYRSYIVPGASLAASVHEFKEFTEVSPKVSLAYRYRGDRNDIRFGPFIGMSFYENDTKTRDVGLSVSGFYTITPQTGLQYSASVSERHYVDMNIEPDLKRSAALALIKTVRGGRNILTLGLAVSDTDSANYMQDMLQSTVSASLTGRINKQFGFELYGLHTFARGSGVDPLFQVRRKDNITEIGARVSMPFGETFLGRPFVGLSYVNSASTFDTKDFNNARVTFGITRRF